jgi:membrane protease YdiL (CAAX protease family)
MADQAIEAEAPAAPAKSVWSRLPISMRAIVSGLLVAFGGVQLWALLQFSIGLSWALIPPAVMMLVLFLFWTSGRAWPDKTRLARTIVFRPIALTPSQWVWSLAAALFSVICVGAGFAALFRLAPLSQAAPANPAALAAPGLAWALAMLGALVAGICEETGFRGYMQLPIERRHGPLIAILASSALFTLFHLSQVWAVPAALALLFSAGVLLGLLAWASNSLIPGMIAHAAMALCTFAYGRIGLAGEAAPGADGLFFAALAAALVSLGAFLFMIARLRTTPRTP